MKRTLVASLVIFCSVLGWAQQEQLYGGGMGFFAAGGQVLGIGELSERLSQAGYGKLPGVGMLIGGGGMGWIGNFGIGGEGYVVLERRISGATGEAALSGGWGMFSAAYAPFVWDGIRISAIGSIGGGSLGIALKRGELEVPFDSLLQRPLGNARLSTGGWLAQVAAGAELELLPGLLVGLRAGYVLPIGWDAPGLEDGGRVPGVPKADLRGWSLRLFLGGGSPIRRTDYAPQSD
ncbi:MAG: hypothetical protein NZ960_07450 [Candidatus Kapabacteria bacterium]|nr:hypothetical protein [Candidatus Kapabacteria bacterium]MDW8012816.1 hypothetical protein [Bacteroidota bacterium]